MKSSNLIKLLALLLCIVLALASCGETAQGVQGASPTALSASSGGVSSLGAKLDDAEAPTEAATTWRDFMTLYPDADEVFAELEEIGEDMDIVDVNELVAVFRGASVDKQNVVTETYIVYNLLLEKTVLTVTNKFTAVEEFEDEQDTGLYVGMIESTGAIVVSRRTIAAYTEEELESNFRLDEDDVKTTYTYEFYDYAGTLLAESDSWLDVDGGSIPSSSYGPSDRWLTIGSRHFVLNFFCELKASYQENDANILYDCESDDYGYCLYADATWADYCIQVFNKKTGDLVLQRNFHDEVEYHACVLNDGNILVQSITYVVDPQANYNLVWHGDKANIETFIIDVKTGEETALETEYFFNYMQRISDCADWERYNKIRGYGYNVEYSSKVQNFAGAYKIVDKQVDYATNYSLALNNDGSVAWDGDDLIPQDILSDGTLVYYYANTVKLVRPNGESYLVNENAEIDGDFIVYGERVYDLDKNLIVDLTNSDYEIIGVLGDYVIARYVDDDNDYHYRAYYVTSETDEEGNAVVGCDYKYIFDGVHNDGETIVTFDSNYVVARDTESGIVTLYNAELQPVLRAPYNVYVMSYGDVTYAISSSGGIHIYALKPASDAGLAD